MNEQLRQAALEALNPGADLDRALRAGTALLRDAGVDSPNADMIALAAHTLDMERGQVLARALTGDLVPQGLRELVLRRAERVPLQHLTGRAYFRHISVQVGPGVFVPRVETESVVQIALDHLAESALTQESSPLVVDLGTGSGAIALAIKNEVPAARVHAVELSQDALFYTRENLAGSGVVLHEADMRDALPELEGAVDVVISNPPYIPPDAVPTQPEARKHDPAMALYGGGEDGLDLPRAAVASAARLLRPGGFFVMEHAHVQRESARALLTDSGLFTHVRSHVDLADKNRATSAVRRG